MFVGVIYVESVNQLLYVLIFISEWHFISKKTDPGQLHEISVCKDQLIYFVKRRISVLGEIIHE